MGLHAVPLGAEEEHVFTEVGQPRQLPRVRHETWYRLEHDNKHTLNNNGKEQILW